MFLSRWATVTPDAAAAILGVPVSASRREIVAGYLVRARMTHPDRFADAPAGDIAAASSEFMRVTLARDVLCASLPGAPLAASHPSGEHAAPARRARERARFDCAAAAGETRTWIA